MGAVETYEAEAGGRKYRFDVDYDEYPESPMEWFSQDFDRAIQQGDFAIIGLHRRYDIGHKHNFKTGAEIEEWLEEERGKGRDLRSIELYMYEHSSIVLSTKSFIGRAQHAEWDSGQLGIVVWDFAQANDDAIVDRIEDFLEIYTQYLNGEAYYTRLSEIDDEGEEVEVIDFMGSQYQGSMTWAEFIKESMQGCGDEEIQAALMKEVK